MFTIQDYRKAYAGGRLTPSAAMDVVFNRIASHNDPAMFIALRSLEDVKAEAKKLETRKAENLPLYGIPFAVKDNIDVAGLPTTAACPDFAYVPQRDATAVARLRAAGAIVIGKTNLDQFATGLVGVRSPYGTPRNTFQADIVPGGSSSGSAVAVAAGIVPIALGTDTAGSGRVPAGLNNIVGLKPSLGLISTTGVLPACRTLDCVSIFALDVADAYSVLALLAHFDEADPFSKCLRIENPVMFRRGTRIGIPDAKSLRFGGDRNSEAAFDSAVSDVTALGAELRTVDLTAFYEAAALLYEGAWVAERYQAIRNFIEKQPNSLHPVTLGIIQQAKRFSAADAFSGLYKLAALKRKTEALWQGIDMLLVPTFPRPHTLAALEKDPIGPNSEFGTYTNFVNLLDLCALAVPGRFRSDGLPSGITLIAPSGSDVRLATAGAALHQMAATQLGATGAKLEETHWPEIGTGMIELVVVGAHMSGLPLNPELTERGGCFLRKAATTADYRLFALPGGPPFRPGMLRVENGTGTSIEVEVWALPPAAFGDFVSNVPSPLTIGTVRLADGSRPKGFLVEAEDSRTATDISHFGGWRAYIRSSAA